MITSIITNLMVTNMSNSLDFYHQIIGLEIAFTVNAEKESDMSGKVRSDAVFASLKYDGGEIMLQERNNMAADAGVFSAKQEPGGTLTLYFRSDSVDEIAGRLTDDIEIVKPLETTWYGMKEIWIRDPDGWVITIGTPEGPSPDVKAD